MADIHEAKYQEMQKYVPFIQRVIDKLKVNNDHQADNNPRKAQLQKMEMLYDLLTNKHKKIKNETLTKCEGVLIKLQAKIEKNEDSILNDVKLRPEFSSKPSTSISKNGKEPMDILGPASPPPEIILDYDMDQPVVIPTERCCSPILGKESDKCSAGKSLHDKKETSDHHKQNKKVDDLQILRNRLFNLDCKSDSSNLVSGKQNSSQNTSDLLRQTPPHSNLVSGKQNLSQNTSDLLRQTPPHYNTTKSIVQEHYHGKGKQDYKHFNYKSQKKSYVSSKSLSPGQKHQTVKVVITEPLPVHIKQQHFPSTGKYLQRSSVCYDNLRTLPLANQTKIDKNEAYSPEELWEQYNESRNTTTSEKNDSSASIFSRLGAKVSEDSSSPSKSKTPGRYTPIPDVLKSPPLSVSDINNLLLESGSDKTLNDISEIGSRRPPKNEGSQKSTPNNSFEFVRKKLAHTARMNSPQANKDDRNISSLPHERLALKYNPHPRRERLQSVSSTDDSECSTQSKISDPRIKSKMQKGGLQHSPTQVAASNVNVLPAINLCDPRLKKQNIHTLPPETKSLPSSAHVIASTPNMAFQNQNSLVFGSQKDPRISRITNNSSVPATTTQRQSTSQPQYSSEENWDTDEEEKSNTPIKNDPRLTKKEKKDQHVENIYESSAEPRVINSFEYNHSENRNSAPIGRDSINYPRFQLNTCIDKVSILSPEKEVTINKPWQQTYDDAKKDPHKTQTNIKDIKEKKPKEKFTSFATFVVPNPPKSDTEEDWDSEPEITTIKPKSLPPNAPESPANISPVVPIVSPYHKQISPKAVVSPINVSTAPIPPVHPMRIPFVQSQYPMVGPSVPHTYRMQNTVANNRFNSILNDKSERIKYFESKKQKSIEPRTYKEFREAKERAQAQEAAIKRAAEEAEAKKRAAETKAIHKDKRKDMNENVNDQKAKHNTATTKIEDDKKEKKLHHKDNKNHKTGESSLDKMYRTQNFNTNFPKSNTSFKIPKKKTEEKVKEEIAKANAVGAEQTRHLPSDKPEDKIKPKQTDISEKQDHNDKGCNNKSTYSDTKTNQAIFDVTRDKVEENNISQPSTTTDSLPIKCSTQTQNLMNNINNITEEKTYNQTNTDNISFNKQNSKENENQEKNQENLSEANLSKLDVEDNKINKRDPRCRLKIAPVITGDIKEPEIHEENLNTLGDIVITSSENQVILKPQQNLEKFNKLTQDLSPKPQRILRRRNTMLVYDSAPLVDKEKLNKANAMLFEDVQEEEKRKRKQAEEDRIIARRNKHLEEMFKRTDDNCTVSTQNIISGKRRTRTLINFNETVNAINIFKHKTMKDSVLNSSNVPPPTTQVTKPTRSNFVIKIKNIGNLDSIKCEESEDDEPLDTLAKKEAKTRELKSSKTKVVKETQLKEESKADDKTSTKLVKKRTPSVSRKALSNSAMNVDTTTPNEEHQNCAVSSTSTDNYNLEESSCSSTSTNRHFKKETDDNIPTSTGSKSSNPTATPEPNEPVLREIVDQILKPNANREPILGILAQILSEEKLELIKTLIESSNKQSEDKQIKKEEDSYQEQIQLSSKSNNKKTKDAEKKEEDEEERKSSTSTKTSEGKKVTMPKKKRNELDRLNEDIRDMFICNGVLTATGRRMCTMMGKDVETVGSKKASSMSEQDNINKKQQEVLKPPVTRTLRRSTRSCKTNIEDNEDNESILSRTTEDSIDDFNTSTEKKTATDTTPQRKMPVLKPHTPIKIADEILPKATKSKEVGNKRKSDSKLGFKAKKSKEDSKQDSEPEEKESDTEVEDVEEERENPEMKIIKNTNVHWHNQSKYTTWCMICEKKILGISSSLHYKTHHRENYISRMAPVLLQQFKQGKLNKPLFGVKKAQKQPSWFYRCPFCLKYFNTPMSLWLEHFQNHTVEFRYECSKCHRCNNKKLTIIRHVKRCKGATVITSDVKLNVPNVINAHVCHLCNFIQLKRDNLERHYIEQHQLQKKTVDLLGYTLKLFDVENVECVKEEDAAKRESDAWKSIQKDEQVIDIDDDEAGITDNNNLTVAEISAEIKKNSEKEKNQNGSNSINLKLTNASEDKKNGSTIETNLIKTGNSYNISNLAEPKRQNDKSQETILNNTSIKKDNKKSVKPIKQTNTEEQVEKIKQGKEKVTKLQTKNLTKKVEIPTSTSVVKRKKAKQNIIFDLTDSESSDLEIIDQKVIVQDLQDELLILAAEAAEKENPTEGSRDNMEIRTSFSNVRINEKSKETNLPNQEITNQSSKTTASTNRPFKPQARISDIISTSIDMIYNRESVTADTNKLSLINNSLEHRKVCPTASNIFMPTRDENNYSPTIQILAQSIINIEEQGNDSTKEKPITMAERLSQRLMVLQNEGTTAEKSAISSPTTSSNRKSNENAFEKLINDTLFELTKEKDSANISSKNQSHASTPAVALRKENVFDKLFNETVLELEKDDVHENESQLMQQKEIPNVSKGLPKTNNIPVVSDDEDWEDIEITETAPTPSTASTASTQKSKSKGLFQKYGIFKGNNTKPKKHITPMVFLPKKKSKEKSQTPSVSHSATTTTPVAITKSNDITTTTNSLSNSNAQVGFKPVINIMDGLFPDSPCNDPIDLVPELAPLEPLQDLNDISSILDSNLSAVNINAADNHTSIEDALDFISEQQANDKQKSNNSILSVTHGQTKNAINNISHVGFSVQSAAGNDFKFYCLLQNCSFLYSSDSIGLETHFMCEHSQIKWNGYCLMCQSQCFPNSGDAHEEHSISKEIRHMMEKHAKKPALDADSTQHLAMPTHDNEERPKIKLRRLTGDCLSRATPENVVPEVVSTELTTTTAPPLSMLGALLVAEPKPPTKEMPPQPQMPLTEPLLLDNNTNVSSQLPFRNVTSDFQITSVVSADPNTNETPLQISNVISLNNNAISQISESEQIQVPKISNVRTLAQKAGRLWTQQIEQEALELADAAVESLEITRILENAGKPSRNRESTRSANDSPVIVAETVPIAQSTTGDFVVTQTISAQYDEFSSAALGFNISIATSTASDKTNPDSNSSSVSSRQYKCMGSGCKFVSRVPVAMSDHLRFHERRNFSNKQDFLACGFCFYCACDVEDYMKHANQFHIINKASTAQHATIANESDTVSSLSKKIHNILSNSSGSSGQNRYTGQIQQQNQAKQVQDTQEVYLRKLRETIDEIVGPTGLADDKLYRCVIKNCHSQLTESTFLSHIMFHITTTGGNPNNYLYKCPHCTAQYHRAGGIKVHIKNHARNHFFCYLCDETSTNPGQILKHFSEKHWNAVTMYTKELLQPKVSNDCSDLVLDSSYYVAYTQDLSAEDIRKFGEKLILEWKRKKSGSKTHFKSTEIDLLPLSAIFQRQVNCGECEYKTKVRTNMFRHLLMHKQNPGLANNSGMSNVGSVDPVNPVPCLNSTERFFDKMTNLASSSLISSSSGATSTKSSFKLPQGFVEESKRYSCGCPSCNYHTISEDLFRTHLSTLHSTAMTYCCPFCKEEICKRGITIDRIMNHTRFHGTTIYRCEECNYVHHLRYVVERHINEKHSTMKVNIVTHNRSIEDNIEGAVTITQYAGKKYKDPVEINETAQTSNPITRSTNSESSGPKPITTYVNSAKGKGKWVCDVCGHKTSTIGLIQTHCQQQHAVKNQYKCAHCNFGSQQLSHILYHIDERHSGKTREARTIYHKIVNNDEELTDTRPLWQRNDPKRIRHIRGILMEDEDESEEYRKKLALTEDIDDESNESQNVNENDEAELSGKSYISGYEFGCYHCSFKTQTFEDLKEQHYMQNHNFQLETSKPFWYRLHRRLCCPECRKFVGNYSELQQHLQNTHKTSRFYAADIRMAENEDTSQRILCGYCAYHCANVEHLYRHHVKAQHWPQDIRIDNNEQIMQFMALGNPGPSYQCTLCADIFSNRIAIVQHARNSHAGEDSFSFRELTNSLIYRCHSCCFTSTTEMELLRHTIDHYSRFKVCSFCQQSQSSFNVYMQHCYTEHKNDILRFRTIYPFTEIRTFLLQTLVIFPSGLVLNKRNLLKTQYAKTHIIDELYEEIYKISQQPPIPRLSIARLVARKSIEAQQKNVENSSSSWQDDTINTMLQQPKTISKRRCTMVSDNEINHANRNSLLKPKNNIIEGKIVANIAKRRTTVDQEQQPLKQDNPNNLNPPLKANKISKRRRTVAVDRETLFSSNLMPSTNSLLTEIETSAKKRKISLTHSHKHSPKHIKEEYPLNLDMEPFSFYGKEPENLDLSKIYTKVSIGGIKTPLTIDKFKLLFNIDCQLKLNKCDLDSQLLAYNDYKHIKKACPASQKLRHD